MMSNKFKDVTYITLKQFQKSSVLDADEMKVIAKKTFDFYVLMNPEELEDSDFSDFFDYLETKYSPNMGVGDVLVETESPHDESWYEKRDIEFSYWNDYENLLVEEEWSPKVVGAINTVTDKILGLLPDPRAPQDSWYRRGLVLGHVQSGKTANYIGVLSKAADAGYKFIIVIAGIHNNLRKQTQQRVDEGFIGRDSVTNEPLGVGILSPNRIRPINLTDLEKDFDKTVRVPLELKHTDKPIVLVIKKNVNTLSNLYNWLKKLNTTAGFERIADTPVLMIDDEADNASINTNKPELDPTRTNKEIRNILNLFNKRAYLAYTATPFANIFINPENVDELYGDDLFPKDFIYCLDAPTNYFGSEKIFLDEDFSKKAICAIDDAHLHIPVKQKKGGEVNSLPRTLINAIHLFLLATTIRRLRGHDGKHSSMLINVHILTDIQRQVKYLVDDELRGLKNKVKFNCNKSLEDAEKNPTVQNLKTLFNQEYSDAGFDWSVVLPSMGAAVDEIKTFMVNSQSEDRLDYSEYDKNNESVTAIAIGGLSLSRGLTLEGLTISYIFRNSKMYDTLLQMGRWFGYRVDYEDLCRIYMTEESLGWYTHISEVAEELRAQLKRMRRDGKSPIDFGLQVRAHPDTLIVTALNKMRHAESRAIEISFLGTLTESFIVPDTKEKNNLNHLEVEKFFGQLSSTRMKRVVDKTGSYCFFDAKSGDVEDFVRKFSFHSGMIELRDIMPDFIRKTVSLFPHWDVIFKSPKSGDKGNYCIADQKRSIGHNNGKVRVPELESGYYLGNKQRFSGASMFAIGLEKDDVDSARVLASQQVPPRKNPIHTDYTNVREKPIIMLHYLTLVDNSSDVEIEVIKQVPALSICFPSSSEYVTVEYVVNPVWLKQLQVEEEGEGQEEDFDYE
jgi:hypothetical protein